MEEALARLEEDTTALKGPPRYVQIAHRWLLPDYECLFSTFFGNYSAFVMVQEVQRVTKWLQGELPTSCPHAEVSCTIMLKPDLLCSPLRIHIPSPSKMGRVASARPSGLKKKKIIRKKIIQCQIKHAVHKTLPCQVGLDKIS